MLAFKRTGSVVALQWEGAMLDPRDQEFAQALQAHRFRTIENAASEEVSVGWITPADPNGDSFEIEDLDGGCGTWLQFRTDVKKLPTKWLQNHRAAVEKARGRKLSARERRELKDDLAEKLLPRVLPTTHTTDALLFHERRLVLLFATAKGARESFAKLVHATFGVALEVVGPRHLAVAAAPDLQADIEKLQPTRWPVAKGAP